VGARHFGGDVERDVPRQLRLGACARADCARPGSHGAAQAKNALGQNPCLVAAILVAAPTCFDDAYDVDPLANGSTYAGTGGVQAPCVCNDVVYSLFAACADCQGQAFATFKDFTGTCNKTFPTYQGTVPPSTEVPGWAQMNIEVRLARARATPSLMRPAGCGQLRPDGSAGLCVAGREREQLLVRRVCVLRVRRVRVLSLRGLGPLRVRVGA
jgi:hypothetical protein